MAIDDKTKTVDHPVTLEARIASAEHQNKEDRYSIYNLFYTGLKYAYATIKKVPKVMAKITQGVTLSVIYVLSGMFMRIYHLRQAHKGNDILTPTPKNNTYWTQLDLPNPGTKVEEYRIRY